MKKARIINAIVWSILAVAISAGVVITWNTDGCEVKSLILGVAFYLTTTLCLGACVDQCLQGK